MPNQIYRKQPTILVIEPDPDQAHLLKCWLKNNKYGYVIAASTDDAFKQQKYKAVDLILLELLLHKKDGLDFIEHVKYDKYLKDVPIIIVSQNEHESDIVQGLNAGAIEYMRPRTFRYWKLCMG